MAAGAASAFPPMLDHAATEATLGRCGVAWTAPRHGFYAASGIGLIGDALRSGVLQAPADGEVSCTTHGDLAEAAAIILAEARGDDGPRPPLAGSQSLDLAGIASGVLGRPVRRWSGCCGVATMRRIGPDAIALFRRDHERLPSTNPRAASGGRTADRPARGRRPSAALAASGACRLTRCLGCV